MCTAERELPKKNVHRVAGISKRGPMSNPTSGRPPSFFEWLGNSRDPIAIRKKYATALVLIRRETEGIFSVANGYSIKRFSKWTDAQKRKVRRYYNTIQGLYQYQARVKVKAPRDKKQRAAAQRVARHPGLFGKLKHVFVPGVAKYKPTIKFTNNNKAYISDNNYAEFASYFKQYELLTDDEDELYDACKRVWNTMLSKAGADMVLGFVTLITGEAQSFNFGLRVNGVDDLFSIVTAWVSKYGDIGVWLRGVNGYFRGKHQKQWLAPSSVHAQHNLELDERAAQRKKERRLSPEAKAMAKRRVKKEVDTTLKIVELKEIYRQLREKYEQMEREGRGFIRKDRDRKFRELEERIKEETDKQMSRSRYNKRSRK